MGDADLDDRTRRSLIKAWHDFLVAIDPIRPALFRYCRQLTGDLWDAEDLVQETLLKAFSKLGQVLYTIKTPRAYLLRIATNLWMDGLRRRGAERAALEAGRTEEATAAAPAASPAQSSELRDAATALMLRLAPQERAAFLLVEVFEMSAEEAALVLGTTAGAAKAALHRGRERLKSDVPPPARRPQPSRALLDRFVDRYNARDLPALLSLMRDDATIEMYGHGTEIGREGFERERGWFHHNFVNPFDGSPAKAHWEVASFEGEPVILVFGGIADESVVTSVMRIEEGDSRVSRITVYALCPDVVREVGARLGKPTQTFGYRFPFDVSGQS